jgi:hypothetical protein
VNPDHAYIAQIADAWTQSDAAASRNERGEILENLVKYIFGNLPGFSHWKSRHLTNDGSAEFDVCFHNDIRLSPFPFAEPAMVVECKNTGRRIDSAGVRNFIAKLEDVQVSWAFLVAAQGITGSGKRNTRAHAVIQTARTRKANLLVITRAEIEALRSNEHFVALVRDKIMAHSLGAPFF